MSDEARKRVVLVTFAFTKLCVCVFVFRLQVEATDEA